MFLNTVKLNALGETYKFPGVFEDLRVLRSGLKDIVKFDFHSEAFYSKDTISPVIARFHSPQNGMMNTTFIPKESLETLEFL